MFSVQCIYYGPEKIEKTIRNVSVKKRLKMCQINSSKLKRKCVKPAKTYHIIRC